MKFQDAINKLTSETMLVSDNGITVFLDSDGNKLNNFNPDYINLDWEVQPMGISFFDMLEGIMDDNLKNYTRRAEYFTYTITWSHSLNNLITGNNTSNPYVPSISDLRANDWVEV